MNERVETIIRKVFQLDRNHPLENVAPGSIPQWDSLGHVTLISTIENELGIRFSPEEIARIDSVESLKNVVDAHVS